MENLAAVRVSMDIRGWVIKKKYGQHSSSGARSEDTAAA